MTDLFPSRDEKASALEAAAWPVTAAPRTIRAVKRLFWALETTPASSRTAGLLAAKIDTTPRTVARLTRLAESLGILQTTPQPGDLNAYRLDWAAVFRAARAAAPFAPGSRRPVTTLEPLESTHAAPATATTQPIQPPPTPSRAGLYPGGWPLKIDRDSLRTVATVQTLYQFALDRCWILAADREGFFALACALTTAKHLTNPGGVFTRRVKNRDWTVGTSADWEQARRAIARLDSTNTTTTTNERPLECSAA